MIAVRSRLRPAWPLLALAALTAAVACGGSSGQKELFPDVITLGEGDISPQITNRTLAVGENRFSLGLLDKDNSPLLGAQVHLRFFDLNGEEPVMRSETDTRFVPVELSFIDEQSGKERRVVGSNGVYVAQVSFGRAGRWGVEVGATLDGKKLDPLPFRFDVLEETPEPALGDAAPASRQLTLADVADISEIDSSYPPRPHMHDVIVADALAGDKPLVIAFATPAFCESRTCGPVMDTVMDPLYEKHKDEAVFIHIEPYQLKELREGSGQITVAATAEWGIHTEPWVFVVGRDGKVAAKFEGIVAPEEVERALTEALARPGA
ncbi:MAG: hypothetical protein Q8Q00_02425 [Dehalococcoidia bacterium]|nr:hypothetical protein [Dehalococcoidia bacterium]